MSDRWSSRQQRAPTPWAVTGRTSEWSGVLFPQWSFCKTLEGQEHSETPAVTGSQGRNSGYGSWGCQTKRKWIRTRQQHARARQWEGPPARAGRRWHPSAAVRPESPARRPRGPVRLGTERATHSTFRLFQRVHVGRQLRSPPRPGPHRSPLSPPGRQHQLPPLTAPLSPSPSHRPSSRNVEFIGYLWQTA